MAGGTRLPSAHSPLQATYWIEGRSVALHDGLAVLEQGGDGATKILVKIFGTPVRGDLDDDGVEDAVLLLVVDSGGSGTFYYLAVAYNRGGTFSGGEAIFLGDRIAPQRLSIRYGLIVVDFAERLPEEAMSVRPSQGVSRCLLSTKTGLEEIPLAKGEALFAGEVVIGHELRSFRTCDTGQEAWLIGSSPALKAIINAYRQIMSGSPPYTPTFMVLTGRPVERPTDGFGADYPAGFYATRLVLSHPGPGCADFRKR